MKKITITIGLAEAKSYVKKCELTCYTEIKRI